MTMKRTSSKTPTSSETPPCIYTHHKDGRLAKKKDGAVKGNERRKTGMVGGAVKKDRDVERERKEARRASATSLEHLLYHL